MVRFLKLIHGTSQDMSVIRDNSVHLMVTSPPYGDVVSYNRDNAMQIGNYKEGDYAKMITPVYEEVFRVLKPGRRAVVNVSNVPLLSDGGLIVGEYGPLTVDVMKYVGFDLSAWIIWDKGRCRSPGGSCGTMPYPASPVLLDNWEHIYVFRKPGKPDYSHVGKSEREPSKFSSDFMASVIQTVWSFKPQTSSVNHPAPYPVELPSRIIKLYSFVNEVVLDPFGGSGSTGIAALELDRSCILYELEDSYIPVLKERLNWGQDGLYKRKVYYELIRQDPNDPKVTKLVDSIDVKPSETWIPQRKDRNKEEDKNQQTLFES